ncbi:MAG: hypothetical protein RLZZ24_792 [Pseudomonadota bacterium]
MRSRRASGGTKRLQVTPELVQVQKRFGARDCSHKALHERVRLPLGKNAQIKACSKPCSKMSLGKSMPMNTILLTRFSVPHSGPRSLPMS